jgi:hypothetical protein
VDGHHIGLAEQLVLRDQCRPRGFSDLGRHVLAPGDDLMPKASPMARDLSADIS